jgi:hypothetical protein
MENLEDKAKVVEKTGQKILNMLGKLDEPIAISVINYCFTIMVIDDDRGPVIAKAMTATFFNNVVNSINSYFHDDNEAESMH